MNFNPIYKLLILTLFAAFFAPAKGQNRVIERTDSLVAKMSYATAFDYLNANDPNNMDPDLTIRKVDVLMNYYLRTDYFEYFGLRDLLPGQNLEAMRDGNLTVSMISFKPDSILNRLIVRYPKNYKLKKSLGSFYYQALTEYGERWTEPDSVLYERIKYNYQEAYNHGEFDYWSLHGLAYVNMMLDETEEAVTYFQKSIELNPAFSLSQYNLASAYFAAKEYDKAIIQAETALRLFSSEGTEFQAGLSRLVAMAYEEQDELVKALDYYYKADKILPNDYSTMLPMTALEMKMEKPEYHKHSSDLMALAPTNVAIYQDLLRIYGENEKEKEFVAFMESLKNLYRPNLTVMANVHLHQAIAQYDLDEWVPAKLNFEKARSLFRNLFNANHPVFAVIDSYTEAIKKKQK